jgi:hypothetical protein
VEHINDTQSIEDTPVGHIISHMGTVAPKHYLICDGSEYNISDYPYLVQHIIDNFGTVNYFGGDGESTFCVPDLDDISEEDLIPKLPVLTANSDKVISSGNYDENDEEYKDWRTFDDNPNTIWDSNAFYVNNGGWYIGYKFDNPIEIYAYSIASGKCSSYDVPNSPYHWEFQGSNDGEFWDTLETVKYSFTASAEKKIFFCSKVKKYSMYRINILLNNGGINGLKEYGVRIGDIQFYGIDKKKYIQQYIKYEPTYFMNVYNLRKETVLFEGELLTGTAILNDSIKNYDQLEVRVKWDDETCKQYYTISTDDIEYLENEFSIPCIASNTLSKCLKYMQFNSDTEISTVNSGNYNFIMIYKIVGIKYQSEIGNLPDGSTNEAPAHTDEEVINAVNQLWQ